MTDQNTAPKATSRPVDDDDALEIIAPPDFVPGQARILELVEIRRVESRWEGEDRDLLAWDFEDPDDPDLNASILSSRATGARSKARAIVEALTGTTVRPGASVPLRTLIGLSAAVVLDADDEGWPKAKSIAPVPKGRSS